ncbi:response regulator [Psychrobacter lutiphocae]|uniref:response regulator n=1 Tax=Psychrobacter lutiphocae TaxID=540500 RepID=UPI00036CCA37|nr:response regulator [Psychrobacter lutiphocae]
MYKVLVVEDSHSEMARFRDILANSNFEVIEAMNGQQGVEMAVTHLPDVILMDIVMPEMNGFQATRKITRNEMTAHIPVVMISTKNQETDKIWGKRQGAKAYLTKPVYEAELLRILDAVIGQ